MREVGHASREINDRYTHILIEAHQAAAEQTQRWYGRRAARHEDGCPPDVPQGRYSSRLTIRR